jgi:ribokinase
MPARLIVLGSINMDLVVYSERLPASGETISGHTFQTFPGGKGANQAVAAARMGAHVAMLGKVGGDSFGSEMLKNLDVNGVDPSHIRHAEGASGIALITVDDHGHNTIVVVPGANGKVLPADLEKWGNVLDEADYLLLQLEIPLETVLAGARLARLKGVKVILNPAPARPLPDELLELVDVLVLNETETALISGSDVSTTSALENAARKLLETGVGWVVITLGGQGTLAVSAQEVLHMPAFEVTVVDTVAAGDGFIGALAVSLAEAMEPDKALRIANAAGALAVTVRGAQPSLPTRGQVEEFLRSR